MPNPPIPETDLTRIKQFCATESPAEYADKLQVEYHVRGKNVTLCETRPPWDGSGGDWSHLNFAQLRYRPNSSDWTLHWPDRNSKWQPYQPEGKHLTGSVVDLLDEIDRDPTNTFSG